eukprot:364110-Chlamydomonas_euryale.AAC.3
MMASTLAPHSQHPEALWIGILSHPATGPCHTMSQDFVTPRHRTFSHHVTGLCHTTSQDFVTPRQDFFTPRHRTFPHHVTGLCHTMSQAARGHRPPWVAACPVAGVQRMASRADRHHAHPNLHGGGGNGGGNGGSNGGGAVVTCRCPFDATVNPGFIPPLRVRTFLPSTPPPPAGTAFVPSTYAPAHLVVRDDVRVLKPYGKRQLQLVRKALERRERPGRQYDAPRAEAAQRTERHARHEAPKRQRWDCARAAAAATAAATFAVAAAAPRALTVHMHAVPLVDWRRARLRVDRCG